jgi:hypothetical protein
MFRRVVCLLMLPSMLLNQAAAVGHCHGGDQGSAAGASPHIHTKSKAASTEPSHHHGHSHGSSGHSHPHEHEEEADEPEDSDGPAPEPLSDHDADAVYLVGVDAIVTAWRSIDQVLTASALDLFADSSPRVILAASSDRLLECRPHPPPWSPCPLFVRHLTILV